MEVLTKEQMDTIKKCPLCGCQKISYKYNKDGTVGAYTNFDGISYVHCFSCETEGPQSKYGKLDAIKKWNNRRKKEGWSYGYMEYVEFAKNRLKISKVTAKEQINEIRKHTSKSSKA